jgi:hypothetical protein
VSVGYSPIQPKLFTQTLLFSFFHTIATSDPLPGLHFCVTTHTPKYFWTFWIPFLMSESILCGLAIFRAFSDGTPDAVSNNLPRHWRKRIAPRRRVNGIFNRTAGIVDVLIRDSILYFLV